MESKLIAIIDIVLSLKMEHTSTAERGRESTCVISTGIRSGVISKVVIPIHHIHVGDGDVADSGNANDSDDSIVSSSSSSYWKSTTKQMKEEILQ